MGDLLAVFAGHFAVEDQRDIQLRGHLGNEGLLAQDEGLERVQQIDRRVAREQAVDLAVGGVEEVVKTADMQPVLEVLPTDVGIQVGRPRDRQRMHAVLVLQQVRLHRTVLAAAAAHDAIVAAVVLAELVAQLDQLALALVPVDFTCFLQEVEAAGVAHPFVVEAQRRFGRGLAVRILVAGHRLLVRHIACLAELDHSGHAIHHLEFGLGFFETAQIGLGTGSNFHDEFSVQRYGLDPAGAQDFFEGNEVGGRIDVDGSLAGHGNAQRRRCNESPMLA